MNIIITSYSEWDSILCRAIEKHTKKFIDESSEIDHPNRYIRDATIYGDNRVSIHAQTSVTCKEVIVAGIALIKGTFYTGLFANAKKVDEGNDSIIYAFKLFEYLKEKRNGVDPANLYLEAEIDKSYSYKIMNTHPKRWKAPSRDVAIRIAIALGLTIDETQKMLGYLGYVLSDDIKRDYVIMTGISNSIGIDFIDESLREFKLRPLLAA